MAAQKPNPKICQKAGKKKRSYDEAIGAALRLSKRYGRAYSIYECSTHYHLSTWRKEDQQRHYERRSRIK